MHVQRNDTCPTVIPRICARVKQILIGWAHSDLSDQTVNWRFGNDNLLFCCSLSSCINSTIEFTNIVIYLTRLPMLMQYDRLQPISRHSQSVSLQFFQIIMHCYEKKLFNLSEKSPHIYTRINFGTGSKEIQFTVRIFPNSCGAAVLGLLVPSETFGHKTLLLSIPRQWKRDAAPDV